MRSIIREPMRLSIIQSRHRRVIISIGVSVTMLFGVLFLLLVNLVTSMNPEVVEKRVRQCIQRELSQRHMKELKEQGLAVPDVDMALQWEDEIKQSKNLSFVSVKVKRPFLDILLSETPTYVVQVVIDGENQQDSTRYFWISWDGIDREISRLAWLDSI